MDRASSGQDACALCTSRAGKKRELEREAVAFAAGDSPASGELAEAAFLLRTGWTWAAYQEAPDSLVEAMLAILNAEAEVSKAQAQETREQSGG